MSTDLKTLFRSSTEWLEALEKLSPRQAAHIRMTVGERA